MIDENGACRVVEWRDVRTLSMIVFMSENANTLNVSVHLEVKILLF